MTAQELEEIFHTVERSPSRQITVAITACWVERDGTLTPYSHKWPNQAAVVVEWAKKGVVKVAAHGETHCVPGKHRPRWIGGNRPWHRERRANPDVAMRWLTQDLGLPVTRYVAPGEPAGTTDERVFHDREFVLDWERTMTAFVRALRG